MPCPPNQPRVSFLTGEVSRQPILTPEMSQNFNLGIVNFPAGVHNEMPTRRRDQVLFVTAGKALIATETEEKEITAGDIVLSRLTINTGTGRHPIQTLAHRFDGKGSTTRRSSNRRQQGGGVLVRSTMLRGSCHVGAISTPGWCAPGSLPTVFVQWHGLQPFASSSCPSRWLSVVDTSPTPWVHSPSRTVGQARPRGAERDPLRAPLPVIGSDLCGLRPHPFNATVNWEAAPMAKTASRCFDSDMHLVEPVDLWEHSVDPAYKDRAPKGLTGTHGTWGCRARGTPSRRRTAATPMPLRDHDPAEDIYAIGSPGVGHPVPGQAIDTEGIDLAVLFPSRGLFTLGTGDLEPGLATAISRAYNNWLAEFCAGGSGRMFGAGMDPPTTSTGRSTKPAGRCTSWGSRRCSSADPVHGRNWHDPYYDPLWAGIEQLGVPLSFHEGGRVDLPQPGDNFERATCCYHTCTHSIAMMLAAVDVLGGGVCEHFPGLTVAFLEGNCSWAPGRCGGWTALGDVGGLRPSRPHHRAQRVFRRQCYLSVECDEEPAEVTRYGLEDRIVFSTDYPHADSKYPQSVERFLRAAPDRSDQTQIPVGQLRQALRAGGGGSSRSEGGWLVG